MWNPNSVDPHKNLLATKTVELSLILSCSSPMQDINYVIWISNANLFDLFGLVYLFNDISTFVCYLMPKPSL